MKEHLKIEHAVSSGGVVFKKTPKGVRVALISKEKGAVWCLPKGLQEKGETARHTAVREVREETGLSARVINKIGSIDYWFYWKTRKIHKVVHFFILRYTGGSTANHDHEVERSKWFSMEDAMTRIVYKNELQILRKAKKMIDNLL